jgi:DNA-directed RNA polymerase subunit RPC12/RpoP
MALIAAKCTQCGAELQVESTNDATICSYCGSPFITQKAINHYQVTNKINADTVHIYGYADYLIRAGTLQHYNGASLEALLPDNVIVIGSEAFSGCSQLKSVEINEGVTTIERGAFKNLTKLEHVTLPSTLKEIGDEAFLGCASLLSVNLPENLTHIGEGAFYNTPLSEIIIPKSVKSIGIGAFSNTLLAQMNIPIKESNLRCFLNTPVLLDYEPNHRSRCSYCGAPVSIFTIRCKYCFHKFYA